MNTQRIQLDVQKAGAPQVVRIRKGDVNGTTVAVEVYDGGSLASLTGASATMILHRPGSGGTVNVAGSVSGGTATFTLNEAAAGAVAGNDGWGYVQLAQGSARVSTGSFRLVVLDS